MRVAYIVTVSLLVGFGLAAFIWTTQNDNRDVAEDARAHVVYKAQVQSCQRGNIVRRELNTRGHILQRFLVSAAKARSQTAQIQRLSGQIPEARLNAQAAHLWRDKLARDVTDIEIPVCTEIVPEP